MGRGDDYTDEMHTRRYDLNEQAMEDILAGRAPSAELADLAELVQAVRSSAVSTRAPRPSAELQAVLVEGLTTDKGDLPETAGSKVAEPAGQVFRLPKWRRPKTMLELIASKVAAFSLAAKLGVGTAVAAASVTGAGAAGVLPGPAQDAVASVVSQVTPFEFPSDAADEAGFGGDVAEDATDPDSPGVDGQEVADEASDGRSGGPDDLSTTPPDEADEGLNTADETEAGDQLDSDDPANSGSEQRPDGDPADTRGDTADQFSGDASQSGTDSQPAEDPAGSQAGTAGQSTDEGSASQSSQVTSESQGETADDHIEQVPDTPSPSVPSLP